MRGAESSAPIGAMGATQPQANGSTLSPEAAAILYEANRLKNEDLTKAGLRPKIPAHPFFSPGGQNPTAPGQTPPQ